MKNLFEKLRRSVWSYKQPLTRQPFAADAPVSDLFVWRNSDEWETFFELTDLPGLFADFDAAKRCVTFVFFNANGQIFLEKIIDVMPARRNTVALSELIGNTHGEMGSFAVFHTHTPPILQALGSHLAERGYVSYRYQSAPLRAYVHGNLDAIARLPDKRLQLLGGQGVRRRAYYLQHALSKDGIYELGIVNPTSKKQIVACQSLSAAGKLLNTQVVELLPCGGQLFRVIAEDDHQRVVMRSHLIMARPLVFQIQNQKMDVFHG